jgi:hypothetical protein
MWMAFLQSYSSVYQEILKTHLQMTCIELRIDHIVKSKYFTPDTLGGGSTCN